MTRYHLIPTVYLFPFSALNVLELIYVWKAVLTCQPSCLLSAITCLVRNSHRNWFVHEDGRSLSLEVILLYQTGREQSICCRAGWQFRGTAAGWRNWLMGTSWGSAKPSVESCICDGITSCSSIGRGHGLNGKQLFRKGLGDMVDSKVNTSQQVPLWKETCL